MNVLLTHWSIRISAHRFAYLSHISGHECHDIARYSRYRNDQIPLIEPGITQFGSKYLQSNATLLRPPRNKSTGLTLIRRLATAATTCCNCLFHNEIFSCDDSGCSPAPSSLQTLQSGFCNEIECERSIALLGECALGEVLGLHRLLLV
jgi:hypothetical protein